MGQQRRGRDELLRDFGCTSGYYNDPNHRECGFQISSLLSTSTSTSTVLSLDLNWDSFYDIDHDHYFDEADELFTYMDMFEEEKENVNVMKHTCSDSGTSESESESESSESISSSNMNMNQQMNTARRPFINATIVHDVDEYEETTTTSFENSGGMSSAKDLSPEDTTSTSTASSSPGDGQDSLENLIVPDLDTLLSNLQLAPASEIAYFYLENTIGLKPEVMWKITNEAGSILGFTVHNLEEKINLLKRTMNLSEDDIREIITKQPSILHMSARRNISPTILFLVRAMDLSKEDLRSMVVAYPCILCYSIQNLARKLWFFETIFDLDQEPMRELLVSEPRLMTAAVDSETGLLARFHFLNSEMRIPLEDLQDIVQANPKLMLYSLKNNLQAKLISFFVMRLQMEPSHILKLLKSYPLIMNYSLERHMLPIARFFLGELEFSPFELRKIILKFPRLFTHSLFKIKHTVGYLRYQLGMDAAQVKRVLFQAPQVISLSTDDTLVSKVTFLRDAFALEEGHDLRKVIVGMPTLLLCSVENNLSPKADYLLEQFEGDKMELRQAVLTLPTLLGYSLEKRIRPRMARLLGIGAEPIKITVGITMTDENFDVWLDNKSNRIQHNGVLSTRKRWTKKGDEGIGTSSSSSSIIKSDFDHQSRLSKRIMHWKRS